jgi:5-methylcytosine-specific restriction endonuclease McrA
VNRYALTHVPDPVLLRDLHSLLARERTATAAFLAHLAEVDARRLYAPAGYPSLFDWCVAELHLSEDAACRRIRAARVAREFPAAFSMLADGRLNVTAVVMLAPNLTPENAAELLATATRLSKAGIERLLAERFPRPDLPSRVVDLESPGTGLSALARMNGQNLATAPADSPRAQLALEPVDPDDASPSPGTVRPRVAPLAPARYGVQFTMSEETHKKLRYAQALLGHSVPSGELAKVFDRALDALIARLEQRKCAAMTHPRQRQQRQSADPRHVPAEVRRAVWQRDGGRCTFVSAAGHRCEARTRLEFDHVEPVARGGRTTVKGLRLRCRAHNQYAAECAFGVDFMARKREAAQRDAEAARVRAAAAEEVVPWLRALGLRSNEARRAAASCEAIPDAPLEERVRRALRSAPGTRRSSGPPPAPSAAR